MNMVTWERGGRTLHLVPATATLDNSGLLQSASGETWRTCPADGFSVRSMLQEFLSSEHDYRKLQEAMAHLGYSASALSKERLTCAVVELVGRRRLTMLEKRRGSCVSAAPSAQIAATQKAADADPARTPTQLRSALISVQAAAPSSEPTHVESNFVDDLAHDAQAGGLKAAAVSGLPLCELCEKQKKANAARDQQHVI